MVYSICASRRRLLLGALAIAANPRSAFSGTITDAKGITVTTRSPRRIISIGSSVTEIIVALGDVQAIAAIDSTSRTVPGVAKLPDIGYLRSLSAEGVLSQSPDLICATSDAGPPEVIDTLRASGVPLALIPHVVTVAGICDKIALLGVLIDRNAEAQGLITEVRQSAKDLEDRTAGLDTRPGVLFILSLADNRMMAGGRDTAADSVITMAGGRNVAGNMSGYKPLSLEALMQDPPEVVIMMQGMGPPPKAEEILALPGLADSPAAQRRALHMFDGSYLLGFGPRTIAAAGELARLLHPGLAP